MKGSKRRVAGATLAAGLSAWVLLGGWRAEVEEAEAQSCNQKCPESEKDKNGCCKPKAPPPKPPPPTAKPPPPPPPTAKPAGGCPNGMVQIPGGSYTMGQKRLTFPGAASGEVTVGAFCLDVKEVTVKAYESCVGSNDCTEPDPFKDEMWNKACNWKRAGAGQHPVNCVDWNQGVSFCASEGKRLPTEEEWEWAARGGDAARRYPWGNEQPSAERVNACGTECVAWAKADMSQDWKPMYEADDGWPITAPVGSFPKGANRWGVQDLGGNVWEWTSSKVNAKRAGRVYRGGGWGNNVPARVSAADRSVFAPSSRSNSLGFRCAR